jgi:citronellol/citronellal dehydrogenase
MDAKWFKDHVAYTMSKYGMSMCVLGMAAEFAGKVAVNALWPRTVIATAAVDMLGGEALMSRARRPEIVADAAHAILVRDIACTGNWFVDEDVLRAEGRTDADLDRYAVTPGAALVPDFFV